ncbi:MAG TPA: FG-GAP-like repeat-containing protein, partial [Planctomycetota bacterium]|nr:FG-GAP-like repeat-containing protein [Planctomycetota bacterium]
MPVPFRNRPVRAAFLVVAFATAGSAQSPLFTTDVYDVPPDHRLRRVFDADGDGDLDVLAHRFEGFVFGTVRILWNEGDGRFGARTPSIATPATDLLSAGGAFGDFDGDGDDDAFGRVAASAVGFLRNDGGGAFSTPPASAPLPLPIAVSNATAFAADFDADGKIDVAFSSVVGGAVLASGLWLRTGSFTFVAGAPLPLPPGYAVVAAYAANGDGLPDLLAAAPLGPATPAGMPFAFLPLVNLGGGVFAPGVVVQGPPEFASA